MNKNELLSIISFTWIIIIVSVMSSAEWMMESKGLIFLLLVSIGTFIFSIAKIIIFMIKEKK